MRRHIHTEHGRAKKGLGVRVRARRERPQHLDETLGGVSPERRHGDVVRKRRNQSEQPARGDNAPPLGPFPRPHKVADARRQQHGRKHGAHHAQIGQQPRGQPAERERARRGLLERPVTEQQANHEQACERRILGVEERMRVDAGMQQKDDQREQRQTAAPEHSPSQQIGGETASDEEQVGEQVAAQIQAAAVVERENAFDELQRQLECGAVVAGAVVRQGVEGVVVARQVTQVHLGDPLIVLRIGKHAVIVHHQDADEQRYRADGQRPSVAGCVGNQRDAAGRPQRQEEAVTQAASSRMARRWVVIHARNCTAMRSRRGNATAGVCIWQPARRNDRRAGGT